MAKSAHINITLPALAEVIQRDPASWNSVSLLYLRLPSGKLRISVEHLIDGFPGILALYGKNSDCVLLGASQPQDALIEKMTACFWIPDITQEWQRACSILHTMVSAVAKTLPAEKKIPPPHPDLSPSILIVEDDPMTSKMAAKHLQKFGKVTVTKNAREATAHNIIGNPDVIFLDIHYKDDIYDGFDVLTNILSANSRAFVVMFSANRDPATIFKALSLGAQGFIAKPFHADHFAHYFAKFANISERYFSTIATPSPTSS